MKKILCNSILLLGLHTIYAQEKLPSNSFEDVFCNTTINYHYIEEKQTHDYSGNWDIDGDGIKDKIMFIGNSGVHMYFSLYISLSSKTEDYNSEFLYTDFPLLESVNSYAKHENSYRLQTFVIFDYNKDGIMDIFLNIDARKIMNNELKMLGISSNQVILYYSIKNETIIIKNGNPFIFFLPMFRTVKDIISW